MFFFLFPTAGKTKTYEEVEEMLEGGDPAIFTSDVSTESMYYHTRFFKSYCCFLNSAPR